jgi:hypothetical protein
MALRLVQHGAARVATHTVPYTSQTDDHKPSASETMIEGYVFISQLHCIIFLVPFVVSSNGIQSQVQ